MLATINNWQLSRKMFTAFAFIGILLMMVAASGIVTNMHLGDSADRHVTRGVAGTAAIGEVLTQIREQRILVYSRHNAVDEAEVAKLKERLGANQVALVAGVTEYRRIAGEGFEPEVDHLAATVAQLNSVATKTFVAREAGPVASLAIIKSEGKAASHDALDAANLLLEKTIVRAHAANAAGKAYAALAFAAAIGLAGFALLLLGGVWLFIGRTIARPMAVLASTTTRLAEGAEIAVPSLDRGDELGQIARAVQSFTEAASRRARTDAAAAAEQAEATTALGTSLRALSDGDLTQSVTADFAPAYQALKADFNQALGNLSGLIGSVGDGVAAIRTGSVEIAQASEDLARRTESNAASLEETSAALVQMETRLKASAESSKGTVARADQAIASVGTGRRTAEGAMQAMTRVSSSAKGIDSVIEGVDKIAFQTRVLAMNAAVEAGRAGDAGRGFAVVADLVSALAMRAEEEAKRARDQLTVTQAEIVTAVDAVQKVDGALSDISGDVGAVHKLLASMTDDNLAQSAAITQITSAVGSMDKATQQNAAMVEETSAAARNLTTEVADLARRTGQFRTDVQRGAAPTPINRSQLPAHTPAKAVPAALKPATKVYASGQVAADTDWSDF